jgi:hypothetical protein
VIGLRFYAAPTIIRIMLMKLMHVNRGCDKTNAVIKASAVYYIVKRYSVQTENSSALSRAEIRIRSHHIYALKAIHALIAVNDIKALGSGVHYGVTVFQNIVGRNVIFKVISYAPAIKCG